MIVRVENLSVQYGAIRALERVSFTARPGAILGITGPNGSGKSSLVKALAGIVRSAGSILFDERPVRPDAIGYMAQDIGGTAALTVLELVLLGRLQRLGARVSPTDLAAVGKVLGELDMLALSSRYLGELSGGQRQIAFLAQALASEPEVLLLDEPLSALDLRHQLEVMDLVRHVTRDRNLTTICVLHDLNALARYAQYVGLLERGNLTALGDPVDVLTVENIQRAFQVEASVRDFDGDRIIVPIKPAETAARHSGGSN